LKKKHLKKHLSPEYQVDFPLLSIIAYEVWPKDKFNTLETTEDCKHFYNLAYNRLHEELIQTLNKYHPAAWVRVAYIELEIWSLVLFNNETKRNVGNVKGPEIFAPIGRYGWRYVIEISLEKSKNTSVNHSSRPDRKEVAKVFTILLALSHCSEYSNYLHYFKSNLSSARVKLNPYVFTKGLQFNSKETAFYKGIINYMKEKPNWEKYKDFAVDNDERLMGMINATLEKYFGFNLKQVRTLAEVFISKISPRIGASILVTTYDEAISIFSKFSEFPPHLSKSIIDFILLDNQSATYHNRDFLSRSQQERMLNFSGAIIYLEEHLETIYDPRAARFDFVMASKKHIILTGTLIAEWLDVFVSRLVYGQRQDLKNLNIDINQAISHIEEYFHKNLFETKLKQLITNKGYYCISIDKINGTTIPCGEIDIIAYQPTSNTLLVIEAKYHAPAKDARSMGKVISDHFKQKKYHQKFLTKINWVSGNLDIIKDIYNKQFNIQTDSSCRIEPYFITGSSNAVKFLVDNYKVYTFYEFDKVLDEKR
jgi:Holliday junction resolvase-like predicted endonuclease